jgi:hypothetical protein
MTNRKIRPKTITLTTSGKIRRSALGVLAALAVIAVLGSCMPPGINQNQGSLVVQIDPMDSGAKLMVPAIDMNIASYVVSGTGPSSATFSTTTTGTSASMPGLAVGAWSIAVDGKNSGGTVIGHGSASVQVAAGATNTASVSVLPVAGTGTLSLSVSWPSAQVAAAAIQATLTPPTGSAITLAFSAPSGGTATYSNASLNNGYYTLTLQLMDGSAMVMGAVDVVRIVKGQTTSGTITFSAVNTAKGSVTVNITPQMLNPITVTTTGQLATTGIGVPMTVAATVPGGTGNVTDVWYLNGASIGTGASITLNAAASPLAVGIYRLDVTSFTTDGMRAGSATATFTVATTDTVNLAWSTNTETNIAGYKLYMGTASGVYGTPTDKGNVTTTSVANLTSGATYYFALTAYNTTGQESAKSAEISYKAP